MMSRKVEIPRCLKLRWAEGFTIVCNTLLDPIDGDPPEGSDPGLVKFICPKCGDFYWVHSSSLPFGYIKSVDTYNWYHSLDEAKL